MPYRISTIKFVCVIYVTNFSSIRRKLDLLRVISISVQMRIYSAFTETKCELLIAWPYPPPKNQAILSSRAYHFDRPTVHPEHTSVQNRLTDFSCSIQARMCYEKCLCLLADKTWWSFIRIVSGFCFEFNYKTIDILLCFSCAAYSFCCSNTVNCWVKEIALFTNSE
jgi:hypothetical protein